MSANDTTGEYQGNTRPREQPLKYKLLKQNIQLDVHPAQHTIYATTELIILPLTHKLKVIHLDCDEQNVKVDYVLVDNLHTTHDYFHPPDILIPTPYSHDIRSTEFRLSDTADIHERLGGELQIRVPKQVRDRLKQQYIEQHTVVQNDDVDITSNTNDTVVNQFLQSVSVKVYYTVRKPAYGLVFSNSSMKRSSDGDKCTHCYTESSMSTISPSAWLPCIDRLNERANYEIEIMCDAEYTVLCTGQYTHTSTVTFNNQPRKHTKYIIYENLCVSAIGWSVGLYDSVEVQNSNVDIEHSIACTVYIPKSADTKKHSQALQYINSMYTEHIYKIIYYIQIYCSTDYTYKHINCVYVYNMTCLNDLPYVLNGNLLLFDIAHCVQPLTIDTVLQCTSQLVYTVLFAWLSAIVYVDNYADMWYFNGIAADIAQEYCKTIYGDNTVEYHLYTIKADLAESETPVLDAVVTAGQSDRVETEVVIDFDAGTNKAADAKQAKQASVVVRHYDAHRAYCSEHDSHHLYNLSAWQRHELHTPLMTHKCMVVVNLYNKLFNMNKTIFIQLLHEYSIINTTKQQAFSTTVFKSIYSKNLLNDNQLKLFNNVTEQYVYTDHIPLFNVSTTVTKNANNSTIAVEVQQNRKSVAVAYRTVCPLRVQVCEHQHNTAYSTQIDGTDLLLNYDINVTKRRAATGADGTVQRQTYYVLVDLNNYLLRLVQYERIHESELLYCMQHESSLNGQIQLYTHILHNFDRINMSLALIEQLRQVILSTSTYVKIQCMAVQIYIKLVYFDDNGYEVHGYQFILDHIRSLLFDEHTLLRPNDFSDIKRYCIVRTALYYLASVKRNYLTPDGIVELLLTVLTENDNTHNKYTDQHYLQSIIEALQYIETENAQYKQRMLDLLQRYMNGDAIHGTTALTCTIIDTLTQLQIDNFADVTSVMNITTYVQQLSKHEMNVQLCVLRNVYKLSFYSAKYFDHIVNLYARFNKLTFAQQWQHTNALTQCLINSALINDNTYFVRQSATFYNTLLSLMQSVHSNVIRIALHRLYINAYGTRVINSHTTSDDRHNTKQLVQQQQQYLADLERDDEVTTHSRRIDAKNELNRLREKRNLNTGKVRLGLKLNK